MLLTKYDVTQLENCATISGLQSQSYDRCNWCSVPEAQLSHSDRLTCFDIQPDRLQQAPTFPTDTTVYLEFIQCFIS